MKVEIKGIDFSNKGALLMLQSIFEAFRKREVDCEFVVQISGSYELRKNYPLHIVFPRFPERVAGLPLGPLMPLTPKRFRDCLGIILPSEIDVVLDASGFAYSDQWGAVKARRRLGVFKKRYRADVKLIMLPQAFGPFKDEKLVKAMKDIIGSCSLVYARDAQSLSAIKSISGRSANQDVISQCPDFTQSLSCRDARQILPADFHGGIYLVVNHKVIEKGVMTEDQYVGWFCEVIKELEEIGDKVFFINHEGVKDKKLSDRISIKYGKSIPIFESNDPLELKKAISVSKAGVASRFHAVASSLSQGVPVSILGWSHKYIELAEDYGVQDLVFTNGTNLSGKDSVSMLYRILENPDKLDELFLKKKEIVNKLDGMWDQVFEVINS